MAHKFKFIVRPRLAYLIARFLKRTGSFKNETNKCNINILRCSDNNDEAYMLVLLVVK